MKTDAYGIHRAAENLSCLSVTQLFPQHQPERLAIIWSQLPHDFDEPVVSGMFR
jgi:hypothetical protein